MIGRMLATALVLLSAAQAWLFYLWTWCFGQPVDGRLLAVLPVALLVANGAALPLARGSLRSGSRLAKELGRSWLIGSVSLLLAGLLSVVAFAFAGLVGAIAFAASGLGAVGTEVMLRDGLSAGVSPVAFGAASLGGVVGFAAIWWGYAVGQRWVRVEHVELPVAGAPAELAEVRIAQVTDLHVGPLLRAPRLAGLVARINATRPDVIVMTGDIFDFDPAYIDEGCRELSKLAAPLGVFAVLGNHDVYTGADDVARGLEAAGIRVLRDEWVRVGEGDRRFCLVGAEDPGVGWAKRDSELPSLDRLAAEVPSDEPRLLLIHRPSFFLQAVRLGFPAILSGHTHGGQLSPPFMREHNVSRMISRWTRGIYRMQSSTMYVNPGLGVAGLPVRLNCPREIALVRLTGHEVREGALRGTG